MEEHEARCREIQILKFGRLIDLELVDKVTSGMSEEEARRRVDVVEAKHAAELEQLEGKNRELRGNLLELTYENTRKLKEVADLSARQFKFEKELNNSGGSLALGGRGPSLRKEREERDRLMALVKLQARELDAIRAEINLLRRKGGHIYAPAAPEAQQQQIRPAPAAGNQIEDARANQNGEEDTPPTEPPAGGLRGDSISEGRGDTSRLQSDAHNSEGNQDDGHQEEMKPKDQQQRRSEASEEGSMLVDMQAQ